MTPDSNPPVQDSSENDAAPEATASEVPVSERSASERSASKTGSLEALLDLSMPVIIEIGRTSVTVSEILEFGVGSVVELERLVGEPVDVLVSDRKLAEGEIVVIGDHLGVRITRLLSSQLVEVSR